MRLEARLQAELSTVQVFQLLGEAASVLIFTTLNYRGLINLLSCTFMDQDQSYCATDKYSITGMLRINTMTYFHA